VASLDNLTIGVVGFCAGFLLFLAIITSAVEDDFAVAPVSRCEEPALPAPSEAAPALAPDNNPIAL
jgi:hypothetical protein